MQHPLLSAAPSRRLVTLAAFAGLALAAPALAQTWDGGAGGGNWSSGGPAGNWSGSAAPLSSNSTILFFSAPAFPGALNSVQNVAAVFQLFDLTFNPSAGAYALSGDALSFSGGRISQNSNSAISIANPLRSTQGPLLISGSGSGAVTLSGAITPSPGLTKAGDFTLVLSGNNAINGAITLGSAGFGGGVLQVASAANLGNSTGASSAGMTINSGSTFRVTGTFTNNRPLQFVGTPASNIEVTDANILTQSVGISGAGFINKTGTGTLVLAATNSFSGVFNILGGVVEAGAAGRLGSGAAAVTLANNALLRLSGTWSTTRGLSMNAGGGRVEVGAGGVSFTGASTGAGGGGLVKSGPGTLVLGGTVNYGGNIIVESGGLQLNGASSAAPGVEIAAGAVLTGTSTLTAPVANAGRVGGALRINGVVSGPGSIEPGLDGLGTLTASRIDPRQGAGFSFNLLAGGPVGGDILRLTSPTPFGGAGSDDPIALTSANVIDLYLSVLDVQPNESFLGGIFVAGDSDFLPAVQNATVRVFLLDPSGAVSYGNGSYSRLPAPVEISTVAQTLTFGNDTVPGRITQFTIVPAPAGAALLAFAGLAAARRRRR